MGVRFAFRCRLEHAFGQLLQHAAGTDQAQSLNSGLPGQPGDELVIDSASQGIKR